MNAGIGIGILFLVCIIAVIATIIYRTRQSSGPAASNDNPETLKINADGTLSFMEIKKEYFLHPENGHETENGIKYTEDDPTHMRYFTNKATRSSMWNVSSDLLNTPCDEPDCVFVDTSDRATTTVLLNDIMDSIRPGLTNYRNYFKSKGINTEDYKQKFRAEGEKFSFDILFTGYLEYKGIAVPDELSVSWEEMSKSEFYRDIVNRFPESRHWMSFHNVLIGWIELKEKSDGKTVVYADGRELHIGIHIDGALSILSIAMMKSVVENKDIVNILYDPPPVMISYKQRMENMQQVADSVLAENRS